MKTIYLVACVAQKASVALPAEELYVSDWFRKARSYVKCHIGPPDRWYILSAKYHLVESRRVISPYNETLNTMRQPDRRRWADCVFTHLVPITDAGDSIILLAGNRDPEALEPALRAQGCTVDVPMAGLGIGKQKAWLLRHMASREVQL
jgi:hypothetical protein